MDVNQNSSIHRTTSGGRPAAAERTDEASSSSAAASRLPASPLSPRGQTVAGTSSLAPRAALPPVGAAAQRPPGAAPADGTAVATRPAHGRAPAANPATYLEVQHRLSQGERLPDVCRALGLNVHTVHHYYNEAARLFVSSRADSLLRQANEAQRRTFDAMPRVLHPIDLTRLVAFVQRQVDRSGDALRAAGVREGIPPSVLDHLFDAAGLRQAHAAALPGAQRDAIVNALAAPLPVAPAGEVSAAQAPATAEAPPRARRRNHALTAERISALQAAQQLLAAGQSTTQAATNAGLPVTAVSTAFSMQGRLLLTRAGQALLELEDARQRAAFEAMPRALRHKDLMIVVARLRLTPGAPPAELRAAAQWEGMSPEAIAFLFDDGGIRSDQLALLPAAQSAALREAMATEAGPAESPDEPEIRLAVAFATAEMLDETHSLLAAGVTQEDVADRLNVALSLLERLFDHRGQLLIGRAGSGLMNVANAPIREAAQALPRALRPHDLKQLLEAFSAHAASGRGNLRQAATDAQVSRQALDYLFQNGQLSQAAMDSLPEDQRVVLGHALAGTPAEVLWSRYREGQSAQGPARLSGPPVSAERAGRFLQAARMITAGASRTQAGQEAGIPERSLRHILDPQGRILVSKDGQALLRVEDPQLRAELQALPRALGPTDLRLLAEVFRRQLEDPSVSLHRAAVAAGVSVHALNHLFDLHQLLREDRIEALPEAQMDALLNPEADLPAATAGRARMAASVRAMVIIEVQQLLAAGQTRAQAVAQVRERHPGVNLLATQVGRTLDSRGRLLLSGSAAALLRVPDPGARAAFEALPRALRGADLQLLDELLRKHAASPLPDLRRAAADAGVDARAVEHLFEGAGLREDRLAALPEPQLRQLLAARAGMPAAQPVGRPAPQPSAAPQAATRPSAAGPAQNVQAPARRGPPVSAERAGRLLDAARLIAAGASRRQAAELAGLRTAVWDILDSQGRIVVNEGGQTLLRVEDPQLRAELQAWPRALGQSDLMRLAAAFRMHRESPSRSLHQAAVDAGVSPHALSHLFDPQQGLRQDRIDALPPVQREALLNPDAGLPPKIGAMNPFMAPARAVAFAEVQQLLAAGRTLAEAISVVGPRHPTANLTAREAARALDPNGRLLLGRTASVLLRLPDLDQRSVFESLPRALRDVDLRTLNELLRQHAAAPLPDLRQSALDAGVHALAVEYLLDGQGLREDRLAALPEAQLRQLLAARAGMPAPVHTAVRHPGGGRPPRTQRPARPVPEAPPAPAARPLAAAPPAPGAQRASTRAERPPRPPRPAGPVPVVAAPGSAMPGAAEVLSVLRFFREGGDALTMLRAQRHFNLGAEALIARLSRAGVTEAEAWAGTMPDPAVLWQRVRGQAAARGAVLAQQEVSAGDFGSLLASLERWFGSPTAERDTAGSRKRAASPLHLGEGSRTRPHGEGPASPAVDARAEPRGARSERARRPEGQWGSLRWGSGPAFTPPVAAASSPRASSGSEEDVLMDPGTPQADDLSALDVGLERTRAGDVDLTQLMHGQLPDPGRRGPGR
jgi:hypothetical protein